MTTFLDTRPRRLGCAMDRELASIPVEGKTTEQPKRMEWLNEKYVC